MRQTVLNKQKEPPRSQLGLPEDNLLRLHI
jgi:hypothetical protein